MSKLLQSGSSSPYVVARPYCGARPTLDPKRWCGSLATQDCRNAPEGPAGAINVWSNGTNDQVKPRAVSADGIPRGGINSSIVLGGLICPSNGWSNIACLAPFERNDIGPATSKWANVGTMGMPDCHRRSNCQEKQLYVPFTFVPELVKNVLILFATTQYAAVANALELVGRFWIDEQPENRKLLTGSMRE